jgi:FKBP-type peptidyl-prolyl cis-trans isomerase FklB
MSKNTALLAGLAMTGSILAQSPTAAPTLDTPEKQVSYVIGNNIGKNMKRDGITIDAEALVAGLKGALAGEKSLIDDKKAQEVMSKFQQEMQAKAEKSQGESGEKNKTAGAEYLAANKKKEGVTTTESGLQYEIVTKGDGPKPKSTDTVKVHYHGTLTDGKVFDSSVDRGEPATFPVNGVIKGWIEALQLMPVGSKWKVTIPSELAYGAQGAGGDIGPHSVLVFIVELLSIEKSADAPK